MVKPGLRADFKILLVDSDLKNRQDLTILFRSNGFTVMEADSLELAKRYFKENRIDLILLDTGGPDADTWKVLESAQTQDQPPTLFLMSNQCDSTPEHFKNFRGKETFQKPILAEALIIIVARLFDQIEQSRCKL